MTKACKGCHMIVEEAAVCPGCGSEQFTEKFNSIAVIFNAEKSEIGRKLGVKMPGRYAIKIKER